MKFEELKRALLDGKVCKNIIISGKDVFLCDNAYRLIRENVGIEMPELNEVKFIDLEIDIDNVVNALNTPAVFSDNKIVYLDISSRYTKVRNMDLLKRYIEDDSFYNFLVIKCGDNMESVKGYDLSQFSVIDCDCVDREIALKLLVAECRKRGKVINLDAVNLLLEYTNADLMSCINEITKLVNYSSNEITKSDVYEIVNKNIEYKIYELTEALSRKNVSRVYEILADLKQKKNGYQGLIGLIYSHFRRLLHLAITKYSISEYSEFFGIKEYAVKKAVEQSRLFTPKKLKLINDLCMDLEYQVKTSQITSVNAVDMLVLQILQ